MRANLVSGIVISAHIPFSVPTSCTDCLFHSLGGFLCKLSFLFISLKTAHRGIVRSYIDKHFRNHYGFSVLAFLVCASLERIVRIHAEAVQIQAVVPVSASDKRKSVRSHVSCDVAVRAFKVLVHCCLVCLAVVKRNHFIKEVLVASFANIASNAKHKPERIVIKVRYLRFRVL